MARRIPKNKADIDYANIVITNYTKKIDLTILNNILNISSLIFSKHRKKPKHK